MFRHLSVPLAAVLGLMLLLAPPARSLPLDPRPELAESLRRGRDDLRQAQARLELAKAAYLDVPTGRAATTLSLAKMAFDTAAGLAGNPLKAAEARMWLDKGHRYLKEGALSLIPSRGAEVRGMCIDAGSLPKTEAGVVKLVDQLAQAHFNLIVLEVFRRGYTVYESRYSEQDPEFRRAGDLMGVLVREAHLRGMEVHPWIWTFRVKSPGYGDPVLSRLPALAARAEGKESRFLSPADPLAREYVYGLVGEMVDRYDVDGLLLDYIRYDEEIPEDEESRTRFALAHQARTGKLPLFPIAKNSQIMVDWQLWREQQVNTTVQELSRLLKLKRPGFPIGVAVFRGEGYSRLVKMQHWRHWSNNRWVDWAAPMLYTAKSDDLATWLGWETDRHTRTNMLYPILGVHRFASRDNLVEQLELLNREHMPGAMVFALAHFDMTLLDDLRDGPYREKAVMPHRNLIRSVRKTVAQADSYLNRVFTEGSFEDAATARMLHQELVSLAKNLPLHELPYWQNDALVARIRGIQALSDQAPWPESVHEAFRHRLEYAIALTRANQFRLDGTRYVPTTRPPIEVLDEQRRGPQD